jgi:hypothetical protein
MALIEYEIYFIGKPQERRSMKKFDNVADLLKDWQLSVTMLDQQMQRIGTGKDGYLTGSYDNEYRLVKRINGVGYPIPSDEIPTFYKDWLQREAVTIDVFHTFHYRKLTEAENNMRLTRKD